jgi:Xaa-Pro aminopeptidase
MADQVLIYADTERSPELRHEIPVAIGDAFLYAENNGTRRALTNLLEQKKLDELGLETHLPTEYGSDDLVAEGKDWEEIRDEIVLRAVRDFGITNAVVPFWFPTRIADHLRANGIELRPDEELFDARRRSKNEHEIGGIRRAQRAAEAGMGAAQAMLAAADVDGKSLMLDAEPLTSERLKTAIAQAFIEHGSGADIIIAAGGPQGAVGHDTGSGPLYTESPIVIDLGPRDLESGCFADMTRTFVVGEPPEEIVEWHRLTLEALERSLEAIRPGVSGRAVFDIACDVYEEAGHKTGRTKEKGVPLHEGFFHALGHGVGLEIHEQPILGLVGGKDLVPGDVVTVEPGLYRQGFGGVRLEDLVLVTGEGYENLTEFPYDLAP